MCPPKALEALIAVLIPTARREDVLGDLRERYSNPLRYVAGALATVPFVIAGRIIRTTELQLLFTEALLLYGSFIAAAWYAGGALLTTEWGLVRLAAPVLIALTVLVLEDAWSVPGNRSQIKTIRGVAIAVVLACMSQVWTLPPWIILPGGSASLLLVSSVRILFAAGINLPEGAQGPPLRSGKSKPIALSGNAASATDLALGILTVSLVAASVVLPQFRKPVLTVLMPLTVIYLLNRKV